MASTGAAADNVQGSTIHTSLGIAVIEGKSDQKLNASKQSQNQATSLMKSLWRFKTVLIIDKVSLLSIE